MSFIYPKTTGISYSLCVFSLSIDINIMTLMLRGCSVRMMGSMRFRGIGSIAMVREISTYFTSSSSYVLFSFHRQAQNQHALPA